MNVTPQATNIVLLRLQDNGCGDKVLAGQTTDERHELNRLLAKLIST